MWNYVFYISYLLWKEKNEYIGIETYVSELLEKNDSSWYLIIIIYKISIAYIKVVILFSLLYWHNNILS